MELDFGSTIHGAVEVYGSTIQDGLLLRKHTDMMLVQNMDITLFSHM
jgi:hypothetical protein